VAWTGRAKRTSKSSPPCHLLTTSIYRRRMNNGCKSTFHPIRTDISTDCWHLYRRAVPNLTHRVWTLGRRWVYIKTKAARNGKQQPTARKTLTIERLAALRPHNDTDLHAYWNVNTNSKWQRLQGTQVPQMDHFHECAFKKFASAVSETARRIRTWAQATFYLLKTTKYARNNYHCSNL
jgi:hypothetical protein